MRVQFRTLTGENAMPGFWNVKGSFYRDDNRLENHHTLVINRDFSDPYTGGMWTARRELQSQDYAPVVMRCENQLGYFVPERGEVERIGMPLGPDSWAEG
jgi:hypothetical protein